MAARLCRWTKQEYPGCNVPCSLRHAGAKALKQRVLDVLLPLQGVACRFGLPRASLRLPWAMEVIGLSARMASVDLWHLWENKSSSLFLSALCAYLSPTDLSDLHRCSFTPHAKKSVAIRCAGGASKTKQQAAEQE